MSSTNKTQNFGLNQWEPSDSPLRVDFNEDNRLTDAALQTVKSSVSAVQTAADAAQAAANAAQSTANAALSKSGGEITGKLTLPASTTASASLNAPHGAAPSAPVNGDIWTDTASVQARINGTTQALYHAGNASTAALGTVTQAVAEAGTATAVYAWTPQRVAQAAAKQAQAAVTAGFVTGMYTGQNSTERAISLGFTPRMVLVLNSGTGAFVGTASNGTVFGGMAIEGYGAAKSVRLSLPTTSATSAIFIISGGFIVNDTANFSTYNQYSYIAFK